MTKTIPVRVEIADGLLAKMEQLRAQNAELLLLLGWLEQAHTLTHVKNLIAEFRKAPDFPLSPSGAAPQTPAPDGGEKP